MASQIVTLTKAAPQTPVRVPQKNIPPTSTERLRLKHLVAAFIEGQEIVPPIPMQELRELAVALLEKYQIDPIYLDYTAVLLSNETWRESLATIPYERRLLLLPKCLRIEDKCPAPFDEFGLLCKSCGLCSIQELQEEAEKLGYAVLVAEGSALVMAIIETGKIDAIVGVSCLSVLEKSFPFMEGAAIPGVAIPLLQDDCRETNVDMHWVWDAIHLTSADKTRRMDLDRVRSEVDSHFGFESLQALIGAGGGLSETEKIACEWLAKNGKRWRPFLAVCAHQALQDDPNGQIPAGLEKIAVAVECFHKASLVHDDVEDQDATRYGEKTLHEEHGIGVAINCGDFLLGEGYRLLAESDASPEQKVEMIRVAAAGHRKLALGQGAELNWMNQPRILSPQDVIAIFAQKTAPAFEVALTLGAVYANADALDFQVLQRYSEALGIAYQIQDDLDDFNNEIDPSDMQAMRPSLLMAIACEKAQGQNKVLLENVWQGTASFTAHFAEIEKLIQKLGVASRGQELLAAYKDEAVRALHDLKNANLKGLLRRVMGKIFNDFELEGWCSELETRNAAGGQAGTASPW